MCPFIMHTSTYECDVFILQVYLPSVFLVYVPTYLHTYTFTLCMCEYMCRLCRKWTQHGTANTYKHTQKHTCPRCFFCPKGRNLPSRQELRQDFIQDMGVMFKLKHPNVVNIMGALVDQKRDPLLGTSVYMRSCMYACACV